MYEIIRPQISEGRKNANGLAMWVSNLSQSSARLVAN